MKLSIFRTCVTILVTCTLGASCAELEDNSYFTKEKVSNTNEEVTESAKTSVDYIKGREDLKQISSLFERTGVYEALAASSGKHTIIVATDADYEAPESMVEASAANEHILNAVVTPSDLAKGCNLSMWNQKTVTVKADSMAQEGVFIGHITFNGSKLKEMIHTSDGYIYVVDSPMKVYVSMRQYLDGLDEKVYSRMLSMIKAYDTLMVDYDNSPKIGINDEGNTIYDTIPDIKNRYLEAKGYNIKDESLNGTMLLFSDEVIENALKEAKAKYHAWGYDYKMALLRNGSLDSVYVGYTSDEDLERWIQNAMFYNNAYDVKQLTPNLAAKNPTINDITSVYDAVWRTSVQELDLDNPITLSNGVAYKVKSFHIPNHRLIYRLHESFSLYNKCNDAELAQYYKFENLSDIQVKQCVAPWTPIVGVWPEHGDNALVCEVMDKSTLEYQLDYTPIFCRENNSGDYDVHVMMAPPGTYRMAMGFRQNMKNVFVQLLAIADGKEYPCGESVELELSNGSTTWHYDRGATLKQNLPEFYDVNEERLHKANTEGSLKNKIPYYWTDGGPVYTEVTIPDVKGDGSAVQLLIRIKGTNGDVSTNLTFNHWCLRPTVNNY